MNINELTQDCILHILSKLSLQESIPVRHVCPYWKYLIEHYHYRPLKSLKLFGYVTDFDEYCKFVIKHDLAHDSDFALNPRNHLVLKRNVPIQKSISSPLLTELFPNVKCLVCFNVSCGFQNVIDFNHLLEKWSTTIETLFLYNISYRLRPISLPTLKYLYHLECEFTNEFVSSILPQLEHILLNIVCVDERSGKWTFLDWKMLNFQKLKQLKLYVHQLELFLDYILHQIDSKILPNITHFELDHHLIKRLSIEDAVKALNWIRKIFPNLEYIRTMLFRALPIEQVIAQLVLFPNLKALSIDLERNSSQWLRKKNLHLPQLESIHKLHLIFQCPLFHLNNLRASIQHLFPNLKLLTIDCGYHADAQRLFEQSFHGCLFKYKLVKYGKNGILDLSNILG